MAQMPRGEPRSVPDQGAVSYAAMLEREQLKRELAESALFAPLGDPLDVVRRAPRLNSIVSLDGQTYREVDNGRANALVPVDNSSFSPAERAEQRRAIGRASLIADHPLGSVANGLATLAGASPATRDRALVGGGLADAALFGVAARDAPARSVPPPFRGATAPRAVLRDEIRAGSVNANGQAMGVNATLTANMLGAGTKARGTPPGWQGHGTRYNEARAHLLARRLGGSGTDARNIVTMTHQGANTPQMSSFEGKVARRIRAGEVVEYSVRPLHGPGVLPPSAVLLTAYGSCGAPAARIIQNPAGPRR